MVADLWGPAVALWARFLSSLPYLPKTVSAAGKAAIAFASLSWILFVVVVGVVYRVHICSLDQNLQEAFLQFAALLLCSDHHGHNVPYGTMQHRHGVAASGDLEARDPSSEPKEAYT